MKVDPLAALGPRAAGTAQLLLFAGDGDGDFAAKLTLGQILKGRVLRSYGDQRYAVEFDGQRKVVDSAVPLTTGETLHGRVIGLGERVTLQRIPPPRPGQAALPDLAQADTGTANTAANTVAALFERYQAQLDPAGLQALQRLAGRHAAPEQVALAGLVLNKLGLQITPEFVRAVQAALAKPGNAGLFALPTQALALAGTPAAAGAARADAADALPALAAWLERAVTDLPEGRPRRPGGAADVDGGVGGDAGVDPGGYAGSDAASDAASDARNPGAGAEGFAGDRGLADGGGDLARWILNAQTGGAVAHRVATLPLLLNGELVELDVALFAQDGEAQHAPAHPGIRHRALVFALTTPALGAMEIHAQLSNGQVRLHVTADATTTTQYLAEHAEALASGLAGIGWQVDEQRYASRTAGQRSGVLASVVEHLISPGSVSRRV